MSDWSNLEDIMQDLSLAQGYAVPGRLEAVAAAGPPPIHVPDEASVERSYYESLCVAGGDFAPPDYEQIKLMLDLVKIDEEENDVKSSAVNPCTPKFITRQKEKIKINVALSPNEVAEEAVAATRPAPKEIIPKMFKKKIVSHIGGSKENVSPSQTSQPSSPERSEQYTPSANANVYYSKYLQKSMLKEQIAEDIWVKAEKQMEEIEARHHKMVHAIDITNIPIGLEGVIHSVPEGDGDGDGERKGNVTYAIDDIPPWYLCIFMALQHYLTMIGAIVAIPFILCPALCMAETDPDRSSIISTMIFVTGLITWLQATFGCRLPIVQGGTISFLVPTLAILNLPQWQCPADAVLDAMTDEEQKDVWMSRMCELSGAIAVSALFQVFLGYFGVIGSLLRFVTPLTIAPTVALVGLTLFEHAADAASQQWGIAAGTFSLLTIFSQCMTNVTIPMLTWKRGQGITITWFPLFKLFPVLLTIVIMWALCAVLSVTGVFPPGHPARTDVKLNIIEDAPWFRVPYPGQWGAPTVSVAGVLGMLAGVLACTVESISYYPTTARMCAAPPPPLHAINRGLGTEGLGTVLAGLWGAGNGTNTFGENVGAIGVTKVGSRRVVQWAAGLMVLQGVVGKLGAVFIIIPQPIVGGLFCVMFGMISAFGLSALQYVNLNSSRNLYIIGFSIFFPLVLTRWMAAHSGVVQTGAEALDAVLQVLLSTSILVGGVIGCLLDNLIPGTDQERGLAAWAKEMSLDAAGASEEGDTYDFPVGMGLIRRWTWTQYLPFMPTYKAGKFTALFTKKEV